ncbi:MAG TPA: 2-dehydropantoate 2-reductase [Anaerolineales bacterium]|nr:2-dehydropantoate 2-reductase [Anaerolineales bacterium]
MKIAIAGAGGVGGYFGGLLALAGHEVTFLARGEHLQAIRQRGLRVISSTHGEFVISPARAEEDPARVGPVDYVVVAVKTYHLEALAPRLAPLVAPDTAVVPLLNGVTAHEVLRRHLPGPAVVGGLCAIFTQIESPGVIRMGGKTKTVVVGELDGPPSERLNRLIEVWKGQGLDASQSNDILAALWNKFVFIASAGGLTSLARLPIGAVRSLPPTRELLTEALGEVEAVARSLGVRLAPDVVEKALATVDRFEPEVTTSMQRDVAAGRLFELEAFSGTIVRLGQEHGVPTPVHRAIYALLLPQLKAVGG